MALEIVKLYISLLSEFFVLSDMAVASASGPGSSTTPPMFPADSNAITTAHYLAKVLAEINETIGEINNVGLATDAGSLTQDLIASARWKFTDVLIHAWQRGKHFELC
jgi:exocyst complex component 2